jgi:hypothetical protein
MLVIVALAGCSGPGTSGLKSVVLTPAQTLSAAVTKLQSPSGSTAKFQASMTLGTVGQMDMAGVEQFSPTAAVDATANLAGTQLASTVGTSMEFIEENGVEYVKFSGSALARQLAARPWIKIDLNQLSTGPNASALGATAKLNQGTDAQQQIKLLLTSGNLKKVGSETVDGIATTHYSGDVDPAKLLQAEGAGKLTAADIQELQSVLQASGIVSEHIDLWLDRSGLPAEMKMTANSASGPIAADVHFSAWGAPVTINVPPADQVTDVSKLVSGH